MVVQCYYFLFAGCIRSIFIISIVFLVIRGLGCRFCFKPVRGKGCRSCRRPLLHTSCGFRDARFVERMLACLVCFSALLGHHLLLTSILLPFYFHPCPRSDSQRSSRALSAFTPWRRRAYSGDAIWGPYFRSRGAFMPPGVSFGTMPAVVSEIAALF